MKNLEYLFYCIPVIFIYLSRRYTLKFNRLKNSGKIPDIIGARQRRTLFFYLAIFSVLTIIVITKIQFF